MSLDQQRTVVAAGTDQPTDPPTGQGSTSRPLSSVPPKCRYKRAVQEAELKDDLRAITEAAAAAQQLASRSAGPGLASSQVSQRVEQEDDLVPDEAEARRAAGKQPRVLASKILGSAEPRKPRIGAEYQAAIPELVPQGQQHPQ